MTLPWPRIHSALFLAWAAEARASELNDPEAMALATVDENGLPDIRMVLMKGFDDQEIVFYTNAESAKGREIASTPKAAVLFHWKSLRRQIRIRGSVSSVSDAEADAYFGSRHRSSRIGAWASAQSRPLDSRATLEEAGRRLRCKVPRSGRAAPSLLEGFSHCANRLRVLEGRRAPAARSYRLHARRHRLVQAAALSVTALHLLRVNLFTAERVR